MIELPELRIKLDQMTGRIVSRLKDRSCFPLNEPIYRPDGVPIVGRSGISLLDFAMEGLEKYHATLGRYNYPDQHPVLGLELPVSQVERIITQPTLPRLDIDTKEGLVPFYQSLLSKYLDKKDDHNTYGETAYADADLLELIHERINIGRYVGEIKAFQDPTVFELTEDKDHDLLLAKLKDQVREESLIARARKVADSYELNPNMAEDAFRWMIDKTLKIEIAFIKQVRSSN